MFLLKRRSDGKYWNNSGSRQGDAWVDAPEKCRPFRTLSAVRHSRACYGVHPTFQTPPHSPWTSEERQAYWRETGAWWEESNRQGRTDYFNKLFEVVPVEVKLVIKK